LLGCRAGERDHRHLALPGLAQPALVRELLHPAGALAVGVAPVEDEEKVRDGRQDQHRHGPEQELALHGLASPRKRLAASSPRLCSHRALDQRPISALPGLDYLGMSMNIRRLALALLLLAPLVVGAQDTPREAPRQS